MCGDYYEKLAPASKEICAQMALIPGLKYHGIKKHCHRFTIGSEILEYGTDYSMETAVRAMVALSRSGTPSIPVDFYMGSDGSRGGDKLVVFNWPEGGMTEDENNEVDEYVDNEDFDGLLLWVKNRNIPHAVKEFNQKTKRWELTLYQR